MSAADLLHAHPLFRANTDRLHNPLSQLLLLYQIGIKRSITAWLQIAKGTIDSALTPRQAIVTANLTLRCEVK